MLLALLIILFTSCNPTKIAARKDAKALDRVETSLPLLSAAFRRGLELYPCVNDSITVFIKGKTDTLTKPYFIDTTNRERIKDSLLDNIVLPLQDICNEKIKSAYDLGFEQAIKGFPKDKLVIRVDTIRSSVLDKLIQKMLIDSLNAEHQRSAFKDGVINTQQTHISAQNKELIEKGWYILGLGLLLVISVFFNVKGLFSISKTVSKLI